MIGYLLTLTNTEILILLSILFIGGSILSVVILKYLNPHGVRYRENGVLGNIAALIGIIYGVLAGLTALYLINNITAAGDAVQREANAVANLYRETQWVKSPAQRTIQNEVRNYLDQVINADWPIMEKGGKVSNEGDHIIERMVTGILALNYNDNTESILGRDMLQESKTLYNARQSRINISYSQLSREIWEVILIGTFLTLAINYLFRMHFYLHLVSVSAAGLMAAAMIYLLITLDRPFQGDFVVPASAFQDVLNTINENSLPKH